MSCRLRRSSFIGFTGTPIEKTDGNTRAVFRDCISIRDIHSAVPDTATVPIYWGSRISKLSATSAELAAHIGECTEATDGEAMIVCKSRRIAVDLYQALSNLRPDWARAKGDEDLDGSPAGSVTSSDHGAQSGRPTPPLRHSSHLPLWRKQAESNRVQILGSFMQSIEPAEAKLVAKGVSFLFWLVVQR